MVKIVKHGSRPDTAIYERKCSRCGCVYEFRGKEVEREFLNPQNGINYWFIPCPECRDASSFEEPTPVRYGDEKVDSTLILPGMPGLEWTAENLSGHGGTEINGNTYYTWEEAMAAAEQLGDGWRLPTREEFVQLCDLGSTWDEDRKGRWFGGNHDTDHEGSLFFPAAGYRDRVGTGALLAVGAYGYVWSSSTFASGNIYAGGMDFSATWVGPLNADKRSYGFSVRCVRNVK